MGHIGQVLHAREDVVRQENYFRSFLVAVPRHLGHLARSLLHLAATLKLMSAFTAGVPSSTLGNVLLLLAARDKASLAQRLVALAQADAVGGPAGRYLTNIVSLHGERLIAHDEVLYLHAFQVFSLLGLLCRRLDLLDLRAAKLYVASLDLITLRLMHRTRQVRLRHAVNGSILTAALARNLSHNVLAGSGRRDDVEAGVRHRLVNYR